MINNENLIRFPKKYSKKAMTLCPNEITVKLSSFTIDRFHCHATKKKIERSQENEV